jgi:hypothetical protein
MTFAAIQQKIKNAQDLDFGTIFNQSIELFKQVWVQGLITVVLNMVLAIPVIMMIYIPLIFMGLFESITSSSAGNFGYDTNSGPDVSPLAAGVLIVLYVFAMIALSTISIALRAAFYRICKIKDLQEMERDDYFYFLKKPYLSKSIHLGLAYLGITFVATLMCFIPVIYAIVPLSYIFVVYAFNPDKSVSEIVKLSFELGNKKWLITFGLLVVCGFLAGIVGFLLCFIGIYVTQSFSYLSPYLIYKDIVGFNEDEDTLRIEESATI